MKPIRNLLAEGLLEPGDSFEGVFERAVSFTRMGKVISVAVASRMNTDQIPLSFQDGLALIRRFNTDCTHELYFCI